MVDLFIPVTTQYFFLIICVNKCRMVLKAIFNFSCYHCSFKFGVVAKVKISFEIFIMEIEKVLQTNMPQIKFI